MQHGEDQDQLPRNEIAVVGMSGRFPGARDIDEFWQNLRSGVESVTFFSDEELLSAGVDPETVKDPQYVKAGYVLDDIESFDASFFGYSPGEAESIDPQQRLLLECAWEALENAGYDAENYDGLIGVYAGMSMNTYLLFNLYTNRGLQDMLKDFQLGIGNTNDFVTTRISYKLNLRGPSLNIQTACSTSLVAVHVACQSLLNGECDMALAGGVSLRIPQRVGYLYQEGGILSPDGHCKAFAADGLGTVGGNGAGIVVLKRLEDAIADRDAILTVIKGSAINNDGASKVGFTAPSIAGQAEVIAEALTMANVEAETIQYIEAHGTATPLGDPVEIMALSKAFRTYTAKKEFCAIGSIKTNIGHLDAAAGIAGLIKTILSLQHREIPPSLHFSRPNPAIDFENSPFYVNTRLKAWEAGPMPRRAGVSSFGLGGTNAHVILEEAPTQPIASSREEHRYHLLPLSAKTPSALNAATDNLVAFLQAHPDSPLADVAYTLQLGRKAFGYRHCVLAQTLDEAVQALHHLDPKCALSNHQEAAERPLIWMFPGQGSQYVGMAQALYEEEPVFRQRVDYCACVLLPLLKLDIRTLLYPEPAMVEKARSRLQQTDLTQPALFVVEYALAHLLQHWGLQPTGMIGHSLGEYVAATLAGVFSLEEALSLIALRGQLMQQMAPGSMLAVSCSVEQLVPLLNEQVELAAINAPQQCVLAGPSSLIEQLMIRLEQEGIVAQALATSHAFHSALMEPMLESFAAHLSRIKLHAPAIPFISNVTGTWITAEQATDVSYWVRQLRSTVRFATGISELCRDQEAIFLEVGPGRTLRLLVEQYVQEEGADRRLVISTLPHQREQKSARAVLLKGLGEVWLATGTVAWKNVHGEQERCRLHLPTYPFERRRYWVDALPFGEEKGRRSLVVEKQADLAEWFYVPSWERCPLPPTSGKRLEVDMNWLIFVPNHPAVQNTLVHHTLQKLAEEHQHVITVLTGEEFTRIDEGVYTVSPGNPEHYDALIEELTAAHLFPHHIIYMWSMLWENEGGQDIHQIEQASGDSFYSLLYLAQALGKGSQTHHLSIWTITNNMQEVVGGEVSCPASAAVLGPCLVIPQEYPQVSCYSVDVALPLSKSESLAEALIQECIAPPPSVPCIAYRGKYRWVRTIQSVRIEEAEKASVPFRERGVYLITGGLGGIGLTLAEHLAKHAQARLILVTRSAFPEPGEWSNIVSTHPENSKLYKQIQRLQKIEALGADVSVVQADVTDLHQMEQVVTAALGHWGTIHGVIHAAGIAGGGIIQLKTREMAERVLAPKIKGTLVLDQLLSNVKLDFFVFCSSLSSVLGGAGQVDYCAANAFLDAFACTDPSKRVINWDTWRDVGMAVETELPPSLQLLREESLKPGILTEEGIEVFCRALASGFSQVLVSTQPFDDQIQRSFLTGADLIEARVGAGAPAHPRPELTCEYVAPRNEIEQKIAEVWQNLLGIDHIGIYDNFFELGGHSLLATQIVAKLRALFRVQIPMRRLFEVPNVASLAETLRMASEEQTTEERMEVLPTVLPDPENCSQPFPLTDIQQAYWIGRDNLFELGNVSTHGYQEFESDELDLDRFELAWQKLIQRHPMLRAIVLPDGRQQVLENVPPYRIERLDLRDQAPHIVQARLEAIRQQMSHQVLRTDRWPLFEIRASLLNERRTRLHISSDALFIDDRSAIILLQELGQLYADLSTVLPPLELSFRDYVLAEVGLRGTSVYRRSEEYWRIHLETLPAAPDLPVSHIGDASMSHQFRRRSGKLDASAWASFKAKASQAGITASGALLAAFAEVLTFWSKSPRFTINLTLSNRLPLHQQVNDIVGTFTSVTLLAVDNSDQEIFAKRAKRLQEQLWSDLEHRYVSGVQVLRQLARLRKDAGQAAMPVVFTSTIGQGVAIQEAFNLARLGEIVYSVSQTPQVWLDHQVAEQDGQLLFNWDAVEEIFPAGLLDDMFSAYCQLLQSLALDERSWQKQVLLKLPDAQSQQRLEVNATQVPRASELLHMLFLEQAAAAPDHLAVIAAQRSLTYDELRHRSLQIGRRLCQMSVRTNSLVGIVMEKGWEQVVATLGILIAGAAYLPIDPSLPEERRFYLLEHGNVEFVLTQSWLNEALKWPTSVQRLCVDTQMLEEGDDQPLSPTQHPDDLAYVIYTSGSTGLPKGVMINHKGAVNTIRDINQRLQVGVTDRVLALASLTFDLSVYDIFGTLAVGGTIVMPVASRLQEPDHWVELISDHQVTIWNSVPAQMKMLAEYLSAHDLKIPASLRVVMMSGDWIPVALPNQIRALTNDMHVLSLGGATEASIWSICYPIEKVLPHWNSIPYGKPMENQTFHVLNSSLNPCPTWVPGYLYIGGEGLAMGYWRDEEKTNASFILHPRTGQRLYRTGDLGRYLPDGNIEFLGREDQQVKIQGYRIELGEIGAALAQHPAVSQAVAHVLPSAGGNKRLVAYIVFKEDVTDGGTEMLRDFLLKKLPTYMVPTSYVALDALPLTRNGKVDRQALPVPDQAQAEPVKTFVAPRTRTEELMARIWEEMLAVERVGIHENFFDLGGDSILAIQIIDKARQVGINLNLRQMFQHQSIAQLALVADSSAERNQGQPVEDAEKMLEKEQVSPEAFSLVKLDQAQISKVSALIDKMNQR